jgi:nitroreductase/dihydropteridine reductase
MNVAEIATTRRTCKAFDPTRKIDPAAIEQLKTLLRFAPSSVNSQPWHFIIASSAEGKEKIAATLAGRFEYNAPKVRNASHVVALCVRHDLNDAYLQAVLEQEERDGRFATSEAKATQHNSRSFYVNLHREQLQDLPLWMEKQVYIALGTLLFAAGALGIDACPMEGIDTAAIDAALGLEAQGLRCVVLTSLGYSSAEDFNVRLPKSRLPATAVINEI